MSIGALARGGDVSWRARWQEKEGKKERKESGNPNYCLFALVK